MSQPVRQASSRAPSPSVAMNTASLKFGLSFKATTGTPTITVPLVQASAINID